MATATVAPQVDLSRTEECTFITTTFRMGIGKMRQVNNLVVVTDADQKQLRHQKKLIDSPELEEIRSQDGYMKRHLDSVSCTYEEGTRFLPNSEVTKLWKAIEAYRTIRRPALVAKFMAKYRALEAVDFAPLSRPAPDGLGELFNRKDYPASDIVEAGFEFTYCLHPVGVLNLKGLPDFIVAEETAKDQAKRAAAVDQWTTIMRVTLLGVVDGLFDVLKPQVDGKVRKLYDTHVSNMLDFCATFPTRNLGNDAECQSTVDTIKQLMQGVSVEKLRNSANLKAHVASKLAGVKQNLTTLVQARGRKFR